jgi:drug/metabolite transporter (DMT)-like permease
LISFMTVKAFPISTVGIVCSLAPIFVCLLGYFFLGEKLKLIDYLALLAVFSAVAMVVLGAAPAEEDIELTVAETDLSNTNVET